MRLNFTINVRRKRYQFYWTYVLNRSLNGLGPFTRQNTKQMGQVHLLDELSSR